MVGHAPFGGNGALRRGVMRASEKASSFLELMAPLMGQTSQLLCPRIQKLVEGKRTKHELISWRMPIFMYIAAHHSVQSRKSNCHVLAGARLLAISQSLTQGRGVVHCTLTRASRPLSWSFAEKLSVLPVKIGSRCYPI